MAFVPLVRKTSTLCLVLSIVLEPDMTWIAKDGTFWPLDLLPAALVQTSRSTDTMQTSSSKGTIEQPVIKINSIRSLVQI
ncbi:hypothetical protein EDB82DRAFT_511910, partial [Fusarium venenatum]|uniref:uncharacterized protein n=1 Tax=Fusarium venenatum TaxID=56646 RepID=UPI001D1E6027